MKENTQSTGFSVRDVLTGKSVPALISTAKNLGLKGYSGKKKQEIIEMIVPKITDAAMVRDLLFVADPSVFSTLISSPAIVPDSALDSCQVFADLGLLCLEKSGDEMRVELTKETKEIFGQFEMDGFLEKKHKGDLLNSYAMAVTHLYGLIRQEDFVSLVNKQNDVSTDINEMFALLIQHISSGAPYGFWGEYLTHSIFEENEYKDAGDLLRSTQNKPLYSPGKTQLLHYEDPNFYEHSIHSERVEYFLKKRLFVSSKEAVEITSELVFSAMVDASPMKMLNMLEQYDLSFTKALACEFIPLLTELSNHTRKWANRGFSPMELHQQSLLRSPIRTGRKIGRNEPCPCGSGKKYKKCCGR